MCSTVHRNRARCLYTIMQRAGAGRRGGKGSGAGGSGAFTEPPLPASHCFGAKQIGLLLRPTSFYEPATSTPRSTPSSTHHPDPRSTITIVGATRFPVLARALAPALSPTRGRTKTSTQPRALSPAAITHALSPRPPTRRIATRRAHIVSIISPQKLLYPATTRRILQPRL